MHTADTTQPKAPPLSPAHPDAPAQPVLVADLLTGAPTWIYPPTPDPPPVRDPWPSRLLSGGAATGFVLGVAGHYGPGLGQAGHAVQMAGTGVGIACAGLGALALLVKGSFARQASQGNVSVSVNVTATGGAANAISRGRR